MTSMPQIARVTDVVEESARVRTLTLDLHLEADPGQFIMAWLPGLDEKPFSLMDARPVTLTVARVGSFSEAVHALRPGDPLWIRGPLGCRFTLPPSAGAAGAMQPDGGYLLMVAGGYGVAPLRFLAQRARDAGWPVVTAIGARTAADVIFVHRFEALGAHVAVTTDDGSLGAHGLVTDAAARLLDRPGCKMIYACGPEAMLDAVELLACNRQLPAQLSYERYMRCGFGVCGSCSRDGWLVCRDGPVKQCDWSV